MKGSMGTKKHTNAAVVMTVEVLGARSFGEKRHRGIRRGDRYFEVRVKDWEIKEPPTSSTRIEYRMTKKQISKADAALIKHGLFTRRQIAKHFRVPLG